MEKAAKEKKHKQLEKDFNSKRKKHEEDIETV